LPAPLGFATIRFVHRPIRTGVFLAGLAALCFGAAAPVIQRASSDAGPFLTACLLYLGAGLSSLLAVPWKRRPSEPPLRLRAVPLLLAVSLLGAVLAPAALALGLKHTDGATGALLLALEAPLTLILAWAFYREHIGRRALAAVLFIFAGSTAVAGLPSTGTSVTGASLVGLATLLWALDNTVSRSLADLDPTKVVAAKGLLGASASVVVALVIRDRWPSLLSGLTLFAAGVAGFGLSLQLYLRAQRTMGAARTASVFAAGPFLGVLCAFALGSPWPGLGFVAALALVAVGVALHASETHQHRHRHLPEGHEHSHAHDEHHRHAHDAQPTEPHSHWHQHEPLEHEHEHSEDVHHRHVHS